MHTNALTPTTLSSDGLGWRQGRQHRGEDRLTQLIVQLSKHTTQATSTHSTMEISFRLESERKKDPVHIQKSSKSRQGHIKEMAWLLPLIDKTKDCSIPFRGYQNDAVSSRLRYQKKKSENSQLKTSRVQNSYIHCYW